MCLYNMYRQQKFRIGTVWSAVTCVILKCCKCDKCDMKNMTVFRISDSKNVTIIICFIGSTHDKIELYNINHFLKKKKKKNALSVLRSPSHCHFTFGRYFPDFVSSSELKRRRDYVMVCQLATYIRLSANYPSIYPCII